MSTRAFLGLLVALVVLAALAVAVSISERAPASGGTLLYPRLKAKLNDVSKITVRAAGNKTVATIERGKSGWTVAERSGYAADVAKMRKALIALAEAKLLEEKTSQPDFYSKLGVADIEKADGNGVRLDIAAGGETFEVIVGNVAAGEQTYVRRAGEKKSWLVSGAINVARETNDWLDRSIVTLQTARVHRVTITQPDGAVLKVAKENPEAPQFDVIDIPKGRQVAYAGVGTSVASVLADAALDNVMAATEFSPGDTKPIVARFETFDGLAVEARVYKTKEGTRVSFSAVADPSLATPSPQESAPATPPKAPEGKTVVKPAATEAPAAPPKTTEPPKPATPTKKLVEVKAEADELNARLSKWVYVLPDFKIEQLTKKLDDMLQPLPAKPAPAAKPAAGAKKAAKPAPAPTPAPAAENPSE